MDLDLLLVDLELLLQLVTLLVELACFSISTPYIYPICIPARSLANLCDAVSFPPPAPPESHPMMLPQPESEQKPAALHEPEHFPEHFARIIVEVEEFDPGNP